jgi:hypothetical protein
MMVKLLLDESGPELDAMSRAIAAATSFYGFGTIARRWFQGDPYLNLLGKLEVIRTICSLPGCYPLAYLDLETLSANEVASADDQFPLLSYPSRDGDGRPVNPYSPAEGQYPRDTGFDGSELAPRLRDCSAHRGVASQSRRQALLPPRHRLRHCRSYNLGAIDHRRPPLVPGDSIQPAWGTRLAAAAAESVHHCRC